MFRDALSSSQVLRRESELQMQVNNGQVIILVFILVYRPSVDILSPKLLLQDFLLFYWQKFYCFSHFNDGD